MKLIMKVISRSMNMKYTLLIMFCLISFKGLNGQNVKLPKNYCENEYATAIKDLNSHSKDTIYVKYKEELSYLKFEIINTTDDTLFLFNSYFEKEYYSSRHLHRIDSTKSSYKISFEPFIPYLFTVAADRIKFTLKDIILSNQNRYDFIVMPPASFFEISFHYDDLFQNIDKEDNLIYDFDTSQMNICCEIGFKYLNVCQLKKKYKLFFEFALYNNIDLLCDQSAYYLNEADFNHQAKDYKIVSIPVEIHNYNHPLF